MTSEDGIAHALANKLYEISSQRHFAKQHQSTPPEGCVFHYTTVAGLQGIVETNCLHASAAYFLNDSSELEYGRRVLGRVLQEWEDRHPEARDDLTAELVRDLHMKISDEAGREELVHSVYLACFCQRDNVLSQWRAYGQAGGYSIRFPVVDGSIRNLAPESPSYTALLTRAEYEREKQANTCREILQLVLSVADDPAVQRIARTTKVSSYHGPKITYDFILDVAEEMLLDEILGFKDKAFEEEEEWRLIVRPRRFLLQGRDDRGKTPTKRYFRPQRGILVPYLRLVPLAGKLPIARIRSGPSIDRARASASVRQLLREYSFPEVEVDGSEITVLL
jgi:hypothetical protein